jgi:hypothetical protein
MNARKPLHTHIDPIYLRNNDYRPSFVAALEPNQCCVDRTGEYGRADLAYRRDSLRLPEAPISVLRRTEAALHTIILVRHRADWLIVRNMFST